ncbi:MAG: glycosyltransferase, partial [Ruminococcus sp.]|nr:glycosyltransferase [Ruminococcus sp.]
MSDVLVSVWCATYNHKNYIRDALEGFVRQKTNFRYEVIIHDDASTDGTQEIIEKYHQQYPNIFVPIYEKENVYSKGINSFNSVGISYVRGKYVALCEGDDFWIDEYKLQKQVDFLESHPDYSMCCHAGYYVDESGYKLPGAFKTFDSDCTVDTDALIKKWICPTASIVYNFGKYMDNRFPPLKNAPCGDYPKIINFSIYGKLYFFSSIWSAYRISNSSVSAKWR